MSICNAKWVYRIIDSLNNSSFLLVILLSTDINQIVGQDGGAVKHFANLSIYDIGDISQLQGKIDRRCAHWVRRPTSLS